MQPLKILTANIDKPNSFAIDTYMAAGGYEPLKKALGMTPDQIIDEVKASELRGRGGAGFPTGMKWGFVPKDSKMPVYLLCNADESEPGTFKDRVLIEKDPHLLIEGMIISGVRDPLLPDGVHLHPGRVLEGSPGPRGGARRSETRRDSSGRTSSAAASTSTSPFTAAREPTSAARRRDSSSRSRASAASRGSSRRSPRSSASSAGRPSSTTSRRSRACRSSSRTARSGSRGSAFRRTPGRSSTASPARSRSRACTSSRWTINLKELIYEHCGGILDDRKLKAVIPGGASAPMLTPDEIDLPLTFDAIMKAGSMLGSAAVIVLDESTCIVEATWRLSKFFAHESCGQCTPCREGTNWLGVDPRRLENGERTAAGCRPSPRHVRQHRRQIALRARRRGDRPRRCPP